MRPGLSWWTMVVRSLVACSSSSDGSGGTGGGPEGSQCSDGSNCAKGLACLVLASDPAAGVCTKPPSTCTGSSLCDCSSEFDPACSAGASCLGLSGEYTIGCGQSGTTRQEGETCSWVIHCASGLFCFVSSPGQVGTCTKNPAACGTQPTCDCYADSKKACTSGATCEVAGDRATIACH